MIKNTDNGAYGEELAAKYLKKKGYRILERNFRSGKHEIDLIAYEKRSGYTVFVEVKTRSNSQFGLPCEAVDANKIHFLLLAEASYLKMKDAFDVPVRNDIIEVYLPDERINHIADAF